MSCTAKLIPKEGIDLLLEGCWSLFPDRNVSFLISKREPALILNINSRFPLVCRSWWKVTPVLILLLLFIPLSNSMAQSNMEIPSGEFAANELSSIIISNKLVLDEELMDWVASKIGDRPRLYKISDGRIIYYQLPYHYAVTFPSEESLRAAIIRGMERSAKESSNRNMIENPEIFIDSLNFHINFLASHLNISRDELEISRNGILNIQKAIRDYGLAGQDFLDIDNGISSTSSLLRFVGEVIYSERKENWEFKYKPWQGTYFPKDIDMGGGLISEFNWARAVIYELVENRFSPDLIGIVEYATSYKK